MDNYKVTLEIFEGPLDLLLYLIKMEEVDIYKIPIIKITDQYLKYLEYFKMLDLDVAGEFLVMASTLMYIKSRMLLPPEERPPEEEEEEDPRLELIKQLIEYKKFKEAAQLLGTRAEEEGNIFARTQPGEIPLEAGERKIEANIFDLITAFSQVLSRAKEEDLREIFEDNYTVTDKIKVLLDTFKNQAQVRFSELFEGMKSRTEIVVTFLAVLELIRLKKVLARQTEAFGDVVVERHII